MLATRTLDLDDDDEAEVVVEVEIEIGFFAICAAESRLAQPIEDLAFEEDDKCDTAYR